MKTSAKNVHSSPEPRNQSIAEITLTELIARREQQQREARAARAAKAAAAAQLEAVAESLAEVFAEAFISNGEILICLFNFRHSSIV